MSDKNTRINYVELPAADLELAKSFYSATFGWKFTDYGPDYVAFNDGGPDGGGMDGGFFRADQKSVTENGGALIILYHHALEEIYPEVVAAGGKIVKEIFSFPGGRRFQFLDPNGNELAIWSDNEAK